MGNFDAFIGISGLYGRLQVADNVVDGNQTSQGEREDGLLENTSENSRIGTVRFQPFYKRASLDSGSTRMARCSRIPVITRQTRLPHGLKDSVRKLSITPFFLIVFLFQRLNYFDNVGVV